MTKGLEALKRITLKDFILNDDSSLIDIKIIEKELKALETIKEKKVFVANLIYHFEYDDNVINYNRHCGWAKSELTQQEYDLLKEVLYATH